MQFFRPDPYLADETYLSGADLGLPSEPTAYPIAEYLKYSAGFLDGGTSTPIARYTPAAIATIDTIPGSTASTATLSVDGAHVVSTIDSIGDQDFYAVTLTAGVQYQIGMYGYAGGPSGVLLADSFVEIYDAAGNLITSGDGGADTPLNSVNSGFDVLLNFTPTTTGTYYVNARAFDNVPSDGTGGDLVGDYEVFVQTAPADAYTPHYSPDSPLYALDWGSQVNRVNQTARNPDGDEGPRPTGNEQGTVVHGTAGGLDVAALAAAQGVDITGKNVITIYFARAGDVFTSIEDPTSPGLPPATITAVGVQGFERTAVLTALAEFSKVADIVYLEVSSRDQADFVYTSYQGTPGPGVSLLGSMSPPDEPNEGLAQFNSGDNRWNALNLQQGGFSFVTLIHEFGHGHGLAHPHDNGGRSGVMNGVVSEGAGVADYTTGDFGLNQGVFTMMSYEDGWQSSPYGNAPTDVGYGYLGGLMAFDIAAIQDKYGVNEDWATGDDTYELKDVNAAGTYYSAIWDAGGNDRIVYNGARDATIDLRAATLRYEAGGGGNVSYATGIYGGFTIANSVVIENARGGSGNDTITGNAAANVLEGGAGNDVIDGGAGIDTLLGGDGADTLRIHAAGAGSRYDGGSGSDTLSVSGTVVLGGTLASIESINLQTGANLVLNSSQFASYVGTGTVLAGSGTLTVNMTPGADFYAATVQTAAGATVTLAINGTDRNDVVKAAYDTVNLIDGGAGNDLLRGGNRADTITGGSGSDKIMGLGGADMLSGGAGADQFRILFATDSGTGAGNRDILLDFRGGEDKLDFRLLDADPLVAGRQKLDFVGTAGFSADGGAELRYEKSGADLLVQIDLDGNGTTDMELLLQGAGSQTLAGTDFMF